MRTQIAWLVVLMVCVSTARANTAFTYQGELLQNGSPVSGERDIAFALWTAAIGGVQVGATVHVDDVPIANGRFTVELDFGVQDTSGVWLEITVVETVLSPRVRVTPSPYSLQTRGIFVDDSGAVGIGTTEPLFPLDVFGSIRSAGPTGGAFVAVNPRNPNANVGLNWLDDVARIRIGGTGLGSQSGLDIQSTGNSSLLRVLHNGNVGIGTAAPGAKLDVAGAGNFRGRLGVGDPSSLFGQLTVLESDAPFAIQAESSDGTFPTIFANNSAAHGPAIWAQGQSDASLDGGGIVVVGDRAGQNVAIDNNEIMARDNGQQATLLLNAEGGAVSMGEHGIKPALAYGSVHLSGSPIRVSASVTAVNRVSEGRYRIYVAGGPRSGDVVIATVRQSIASIRAVESGDHYKVDTYTSSAASDVGFNFVIYRP